MLGKKILKMTHPSIQKSDLEDTGKLVPIVAAPEMTRDYLIKQKILSEHFKDVHHRQKLTTDFFQIF